MPIGYSFIYNGISSDSYNSSLVFLDESYTERPSGSGFSLITTSIRRNPEMIYLDTEYNEPLSFNIEVVFDSPVDIFTFTSFKNWLGGQKSYSPLQIIAENFQNYYYNCVIHLNEDLIYNGGYTGIKAQVECDSPWAWAFPIVDKYTLIPNQNNNIKFFNVSEDRELLKPEIKFHMASNGEFSIRCQHYNNSKFQVVDNDSVLKNNLLYQEAISYCDMNDLPLTAIEESLDYDKTTIFQSLSEGEVVISDSKYGIISSSISDNLVVSNFNKVFLQFPQGECILTITGQADYLYIKYQNAIRMGGGYY